MFAVFRRLVGLLTLALGLAGVLGCGAGAYGVWKVQTRLNRASDKAFDAANRGIAAVEERIPVVRDRVEGAKITTAEVNAALREWTAKATRESAIQKLEIDARAAKLAGHISAAEVRLDTSLLAVRDLRQLLEIGQGLGAGADPAATDELLEVLTQMRGTLGEAQETVGEVRRFTSPDRETLQERLARVAKLVARLLATFVKVDALLDRCAARLSVLRAEARVWKEKTDRGILIGAVVCYALVAWIGAGQAALGGWGWRRLVRQRTPAAAPAAP